MRICVLSLVGEYCITFDDGQKLYDLIYPEIYAGRRVDLDFRGIKVTTALFLNAAVGQLLKDLPAETVKRLLLVSNTRSGFISLKTTAKRGEKPTYETSSSQVGSATLDLVMRDSIEYFTDPKIRAALDTVMAKMADAY